LSGIKAAPTTRVPLRIFGVLGVHSHRGDAGFTVTGNGGSLFSNPLTGRTALVFSENRQLCCPFHVVRQRRLPLQVLLLPVFLHILCLTSALHRHLHLRHLSHLTLTTQLPHNASSHSPCVKGLVPFIVDMYEFRICHVYCFNVVVVCLLVCVLCRCWMFLSLSLSLNISGIIPVMLNLIIRVLNLPRSGTRLYHSSFTCLRYTWRFFLVLQELPALTVVCSS
jgi:hypothetical protein